MIATLGIYDATKAPEVCAEAIARLRATGRDAHLVFVGDAGRTAEPVLRRAAEAGAAEAIHFTAEWIDDETWRTWLLAADGAIQLRTHRFGGISGALMDCIAAGVPTVSNEDLAAALDAPATVARVAAAGIRETVELGIDSPCFRGSVIVADGKASVHPGRVGRSYLRLADDELARLLLGQCDPVVAVARGTMEPSTQMAQKLAGVLFPRLPLWCPVWDDMPA